TVAGLPAGCDRGYWLCGSLVSLLRGEPPWGSRRQRGLFLKWFDQGKVRGELVHQRQQLEELLRVALDADGARLYGLGEAGALQQDRIQGTARQADAGVRLLGLSVGQPGQGGIFQIDPEALVGIGEMPVQHQVLSFGPRAVEPYPEQVEEHAGSQRPQQVRRQGSGLLAGAAYAQLQRAGQVDIAPWPGFGLVAELLQRGGIQF